MPLFRVSTSKHWPAAHQLVRQKKLTIYFIANLFTSRGLEKSTIKVTRMVDVSKWDSGTPPPWESQYPFRGLVEFVECGRLRSNLKCVEFGAGCSSSAIYLASHGYSVDAVDICQLAIERACRQSQAATVNWIQADLLSDSLFASVLAPESYDFVFDMQCFHCLRDIDERRAAQAIFTALKPGGIAMVVVGAADPTCVHNQPCDQPGPPKLTLSQFREPLIAAGLTAVQVSLSRFNSTPHYLSDPNNPLPPLAWVGIFQKILWDANTGMDASGIPDATPVYALEVQAPYSTYILQGRKTIETRAYPLPPALLHRPILLLEPASGGAGVSALPFSIPAGSALCRVVGKVTFTSCARYETAAQWDADREKHAVPVGSVYDWRDAEILTQSNAQREFPSLEDGKIAELYGWQVGSVETFDAAAGGVNQEVPALHRVFRSLFRVT